MTVRSWTLALVAVLAMASSAQAQTFTGSIPGPQVPSATGMAPAGNCNGAQVSRAYTVFNFTNLASAASYTFSATRSSGTGLSMFIFQNGFDPTFFCANLWINGATSGTATVSQSTVLTNYNSQFAIAIFGNSPTDVANVTLTVTGPQVVTPVCSANTVTPSSITMVPGAGSTTAVTLATSFGCGSWTSSGVPAWITGVPASGTNNASFNLVVAANTGGARSATITIGGKTISVSQVAQTCTYSLASGSTSVGAGATTGSITLNTTATCPWNANSNDAWITGLSATSGTGTSTVTFSIAANNGPARVGTVSIGGQTYTVNQANGCTYSPTPSTVAIGAGGQNGASIALNSSNAACPWTAVSNSAFITAVSPTAFTGSTSVTFNVAANASVARSGTLTIGGQTVTVNQASGCSYSLGATSAAYGAGATSGSVSVITNAGCPWSVTSGVSWLNSVNPTSGTGNGTVNFAVDGNTGVARVGTLTVAGNTFTASQASGCTYTVTPSVSIGAGGQNGASVNVNTSPGCPWNASTGLAYVSALSPTSSTGSGTVTFNVAANVGPARSGILSIAGTAVALDQANGCTYSLGSSSASVGAAGVNGNTFSLVTGPGCPWTVTPNVSWLIGSTAGTGPATISYDVNPNNGPARSGAVLIGGQSFGVNQADGCTYTLTPAMVSIGAAGQNGVVAAINPSNSACGWTASSSSGFVSNISPAASTGSAIITFDVAANTDVARSGSLTVGGQSVAINQANGCTYVLSKTSASYGVSADMDSVDVTTGANCPWSASANDSWLNSVSPSSSVGSGTVSFSVDGNMDVARTGTITIAGATFTASQSNGCTYTVTSNVSALASGETGLTVNVNTSPSCPWSASTALGYVSNLTPTSSTGTGDVTFDVAANVGPLRSGTLTVAGATVTLDQASGCTYSLSAPTASVGATGVTGGSVDLTAGAGCTWTAASDLGFVSNLSAATGSGSATITYDVASNTSVPRTATLTIGGETHSVQQAEGCDYTVTATPTSVGEGASASLIEVTPTDSACGFAIGSDSAWAPLSQSAQTGTQSYMVDVEANTGAARTATFTVTGAYGETPSATVMQAAMTVVGTDAGVGADAGVDVDAGVDTDAGSDTDASTDNDGGGPVTTRHHGGCACNVAGGPSTSGESLAGLAAGLVGLVALGRRRRRAGAPQR